VVRTIFYTVMAAIMKTCLVQWVLAICCVSMVGPGSRTHFAKAFHLGSSQQGSLSSTSGLVLSHGLKSATPAPSHRPADSVDLCMQEGYNRTAEIICPRGMLIDNFLFASFGDPTGVYCGHYRLGPCHVQRTQAILQNMCAGKQRCSIPTTNQFFGVSDHPGQGLDAQPVRLRNSFDKCQKVVKSLAVQYRCVASLKEADESADYFNALKSFYDDDSPAGQVASSTSLGSTSPSRGVFGTSSPGSDSTGTDDARQVSRQRQQRLWDTSSWGRLHRCSWSGAPTPIEFMLTPAQQTNPSEPFFGRFRGRFVDESTAAEVFLGEDPRDHRSHASLRPTNGTVVNNAVRRCRILLPNRKPRCCY